MVYLILIVILSTFCGVLGYTTWNLLRKVDLLEDFVAAGYEEAARALRYMRALDRREMFEKDDEVGGIFRQLVAIVADFAAFMGVEESVEETDEQTV